VHRGFDQLGVGKGLEKGVVISGADKSKKSCVIFNVTAGNVNRGKYKEI